MLQISPIITLDCIKSSDVNRLAEIANDPEMRKNVGDTMPYPYTLKDAQRWIDHCHEVENLGTEKQYAISIDWLYAGNIGREQKSPNGRHAHDFHVWYRLGKEYRWKGYMTQILSKFSDHIFETIPICHRQYSWVYSRNTASRRVMEKCGFMLEATFRDSVEWEGKFYDERILAKRKS